MRFRSGAIPKALTSHLMPEWEELEKFPVKSKGYVL